MADHTKDLADALERWLDALAYKGTMSPTRQQRKRAVIAEMQEMAAGIRAAQQAHPESVADQALASETATSRPTPSLTVGGGNDELHGWVRVRIDTQSDADGWCFCTPMSHPDDVANGHAKGPYDDRAQFFAQVLPAAQAEPTAREFTNELGNAIRITIEGPTSTSENILTPREVSELREALNEHAAQAEPVAWRYRPGFSGPWSLTDDGYEASCRRSKGYTVQDLVLPSHHPAQKLGEYAKRVILDAIRSAYDLGYDDARTARAVPGDSAPGYAGRQVETDHGGALISSLDRLAAQAQKEQP